MMELLIDRYIKLKGRDGASEGQTLRIAYCFLGTLFEDSELEFPFIIYTIRPVQEAMELNYQRQFLQVERDMERAKAEKRLAELNRQNEKNEESA